VSAQDLPPELRRALATVARVPRLLVASDYDGTLAPIVANPDDARPLAESATALRALAGLPFTTAALISGRALRDLATLSQMPAEVHLVGSHGSEFDAGFVHAIDASAKTLLLRIKDALGAIAAEYPGTSIEIKPASIAFHVRNADPADAAAALEKATTASRAWDAEVNEGKAVLEFAVIPTDKGQALDILRDQEGASAAVFFGDDVTDEKAFRRLHGPDLSIKVGPGETLADYRVDSPEAVASALSFLLDERRGWLLGGHPTPIEQEG
jgi:trehalose 6-phosphate phosphatase